VEDSTMPEPVVFISQFRVRKGAEQPLRRAFAETVELIQSSKRDTALYAAYLDGSAGSVRFVHAFPDGKALRRHFEGADDRAGAVANILVPVAFELYGDSPPESVDQLRLDADAAGAEMRLFPTAIGGFLRSP
jgi:hypothetical protein